MTAQRGAWKLFRYDITPVPQIMLAHPTSAQSWDCTPIPFARPASGEVTVTHPCQSCGKTATITLSSADITRRKLARWRTVSALTAIVALAFVAAHITLGWPDTALFALFLVVIPLAIMVGKVTSEDGVELVDCEFHDLKYPGINTN